MRKWLTLMLVLGVLYALSKISGKQLLKRHPFLKRIDRGITIIVWVLLAAYLFSFLYWLYIEIIRRSP
jgi:hypothetical protein